MTPHLTGTPTLDTERFVLRAPHPGDYPVWESFFLSERAEFVGGGPEHDKGRAWRAFASLIGHWAMRGFGLFVLEARDTGTAIGAAGPWFPALWPEPELGWSLWIPAAEGKGLMAEAVPAIRDHCFRDLGWETAVSYVDKRNARSIALAERMGCTRDAAADRPDPNDIVFRHPGSTA